MKRSSTLIWPLAALVILLVYNAVLNPAFFSFSIRNGQLYGSLIDVAFRATPLLLTALGMTLVIATGAVDLSVGAVAALAGSMAAWTLTQGLPWPTAIAAVLFVGLAVGIVNSFLMTVLALQPIIATLISMVTCRGLAQLMIDGQIAPLTNSAYVWIGTGAVFGLPFSIWLSVFFFALLSFVLRRTSLGLYVEAVGANPVASRYIGLSSARVRWGVSICASVMAAITGMIISANIRAVDGNNLGTYLELDAILAVVIGGTRLTGGRFSLLGTVLGALIIQTVTTTINTQGVPVELMLMVKAAVVIVICLAQSPNFQSFLKVRKTA